jgi:hypothetical protein
VKPQLSAVFLKPLLCHDPVRNHPHIHVTLCHKTAPQFVNETLKSLLRIVGIGRGHVYAWERYRSLQNAEPLLLVLGHNFLGKRKRKTYYRFQTGSQDNAVDFAMGWTAVILPRARARQRARYFSLLPTVQTGFGAHPASYTTGTRGSFPGCEADHSPSSSAKVKNGGAISPLPHRPSCRDA